jgi:hypothetical protein
MGNRKALFTLIAIELVATIELLVILTTVPPHQASSSVLCLLFFCLFFTMALSLSIPWHAVKRRALRSVTPPYFTSLRQTSLLATLATTLLFAQSLQLLGFFEILSLLCAVIFLEFYFQSEKPSHAIT